MNLLGDVVEGAFGSIFSTPVQMADKRLEKEIERCWNNPAARIWVDDGKKAVSPIKGGFLVDRSLAVPAKKPCTHEHVFKGTCLYCWEENVA